jgi:hypothetical protein
MRYRTSRDIFHEGRSLLPMAWTRPNVLTIPLYYTAAFKAIHITRETDKVFDSFNVHRNSAGRQGSN